MIKLFLSIICALSFLTSQLWIKPVSADWPMFRNDHGHTGSSQHEINKQPNIIWSTGNIGFSQGSLIVDSEENIYASALFKGLVAIDRDGNHKWTFKVTPPQGLVFDNNGNLYFSASGSTPYIYSLSKSGQKIWEYNLRIPGSTSGQFSPSGAIAISKDKQTLYTGLGFPSSSVLALNIDGTVKWQAGLSKQSPNGSISIADSGNLYMGVGGNGRVYSLNENGILRWSRFTGSGPTVRVTTPIIDENENIYVTTSGVRDGELLISFDSLGNRRWRYHISNTFAGDAAYKNGVVYIVQKNTLTAINAADGSVKWSWNITFPSNRTLTSPAVDNEGRVLIAGGDTLYVLGSEGEVKWSLVVADVLGSPVISDNNIIYTHQSLSSGGLSTGSVYKLGDDTPTPPPIPSKTPLILIPGIGGSEFKSSETFSSGIKECGTLPPFTYNVNDIVWVNTIIAGVSPCDDYFDVLKLKADGQTPEYPQIVLNGTFFEGSYKPLIDFFINNGYILNQDLFLFPYDWRKDIIHTAPLLDQKIQEIKAQTGNEKVDIVAHSMGGLVSRYYIFDEQRAENVRKLFTLGTPHLGAANFLKTLQYGDCLTADIFQDLPACLGVDYSEVRDVIQNTISGYTLSPSKTYFNFYSNDSNQYPYPYRNDDGSLNYVQIKNLLTNLNYNTALFTTAESFHETDNSLRNINGVDVTLIAGSGLPTLGQIIETTHTSLLGIKSIKKDALNINGDKTVPLFSAALNDPSRNLSFLGDAKVFYTNQDHGELVSPGSALELVKNIINDNNNLPSGVSTEAYKFNGTQVSVHSPVNIHVYDSNNNHTGLTNNGEFETNIPGSSYNTLDDAKFIFLPQDGTYTIKFEATDNGSFDFKIRTYENDINSKLILYKDIPLTSLTKGQTTLNTSSTEPPVIQIDINGDGVTDSNISYTLPESSDNQETTQTTPSDTSNISSSTSNNSSGSTSQDNTSSNANNISTDNSQIATPAVLGINFTNNDITQKTTNMVGDIEEEVNKQIESSPIKSLVMILSLILIPTFIGLGITFIKPMQK